MQTGKLYHKSSYTYFIT